MAGVYNKGRLSRRPLGKGALSPIPGHIGQPTHEVTPAMKQSQVKPGVRAMLSLGRRGSIQVEVRYQRQPERAGDVRWACEAVNGTWHVATPRQLSPVPVTSADGVLLGHLGANGGVYPAIDGKRFTGLGYSAA